VIGQSGRKSATSADPLRVQTVRQVQKCEAAIAPELEPPEVRPHLKLRAPSASLAVMLEVGRLKQLKHAAEHLFGTKGVLAAYAFGSQLVGRPRPDSDLDIGYYLDEYQRGASLSIAEEMDLATKLSSDVGFSVDLRNLASAPLELRGRVLEEGVRIYSGNAAARVGLERELLARYHDYKEIFEQMHATRLRVVAERGL
jgi:predicted nucleotidyltransferase